MKKTLLSFLLLIIVLALVGIPVFPDKPLFGVFTNNKCVAGCLKV